MAKRRSSNETIERLIDAAFSVMHHDANRDYPDGTGYTAAKQEEELLRQKFRKILRRGDD